MEKLSSEAWKLWPRYFQKLVLRYFKQLLQRIHNPSIELAKIVDCDVKYVQADVNFLKDVGLIELKDSGNARSGPIPLAKYSGIELDLAA